MSDRLLIYGANGYTGDLLAHEAVSRGLCPILSGRRRERLEPLAYELGLPLRVAPLDDPGAVDYLIAGCDVVVNAAGPFSATANALVEGCLRAGVHYLDVGGEIAVFEELRRYDRAARASGVMVLPGAGFDVVASDCLAAHLARRLPGATRLWFAFAGLDIGSRGTVRTLVEEAGRGVRVRRGGVIREVAPGSLERTVDFGDRIRPTTALSWGDVSTAYYTTGIPDIEVYFEATALLRSMILGNRYLGWLLATPPGQSWLRSQAELVPPGPDEAERRAGQAIIVAEVEDRSGRRARSRLLTPEVYSFTASSAIAVAEHVLNGDLEPGFQTPGRVYGADFALGLDGVERCDLD